MRRDHWRIIGHHGIGRSLHEEYNIDDPRNIIPMEEIREKGLHALFQNLLEPHKQFEYLGGLWVPIKSKIVKELFDTINSVPKEERYADGLLKK